MFASRAFNGSSTTHRTVMWPNLLLPGYHVCLNNKIIFPGNLRHQMYCDQYTFVHLWAVPSILSVPSVQFLNSIPTSNRDTIVNLSNKITFQIYCYQGTMFASIIRSSFQEISDTKCIATSIPLFIFESSVPSNLSIPSVQPFSFWILFQPVTRIPLFNLSNKITFQIYCYHGTMFASIIRSSFQEISDTECIATSIPLFIFESSVPSNLSIPSVQPFSFLILFQPVTRIPLFNLSNKITFPMTSTQL
jgi:hypothetical protein